MNTTWPTVLNLALVGMSKCKLNGVKAKKVGWDPNGLKKNHNGL